MAANAGVPWQTGRLLSGRYLLERLLGEGGMSQVYLAQDTVLDRSVAVKILAPGLAAEPGFVRRFRREARTAASLAHPGIVAVHDAGEDAGVRYIVMEHVEGQTLTDLLAQRGALDAGSAVRIADQVAEALSVAHARGLVHQDVKPGNVLLTPQGMVKVTDFGIAGVAIRDAARTAPLMGTAAYMSPEQARGAAVGARSDVYSLGVVLYEMLTGRPPFSADTPVALAAKHVTEPPIPPSALNPLVDPRLDAVVLRSLAKDPADRHISMEDLRNDLGATSHEGSAAATSGAPAVLPGGPLASTPWEAATRVIRAQAASGTSTRHRRAGRLLAALLAALLALGLSAAVLVGILSRGSEAPPRRDGGPRPADTTLNSVPSAAPVEEEGEDDAPDDEKGGGDGHGKGHGNDEDKHSED